MATLYADHEVSAKRGDKRQADGAPLVAEVVGTPRVGNPEGVRCKTKADGLEEQSANGCDRAARQRTRRFPQHKGNDEKPVNGRKPERVIEQGARKEPEEDRITDAERQEWEMKSALSLPTSPSVSSAASALG